MINKQLIQPDSIAVVGATNDLKKAGGKLLFNLLSGDFRGDVYAVNRHDRLVQGVPTYQDTDDLPVVDLAILAVAAKACPLLVERMAIHNQTKAFIIISAGFGELDEQGKALEDRLVELAQNHSLSITGPNCIGILNQHYHGVFTTPIPRLDPKGCDLISSSGATAVFLMEAGMQVGLRFASVYSVGNGQCLSAEDYLAYLDETHDPENSSCNKLLYLESIRSPQKILKHATSLIGKGCRIAAIKSGVTDSGSRAASSHTGAMATSDMAVRALFRKAGIVYCSSREELISVASVFSYRPLKGKNIAVITHAGGSAVMLTDALSQGGLNVPLIDGPVADELLSYLHRGSSVSNPIDFLATGTADQLGIIIDFCEYKMPQIDAMVVVFGSPGLFDVENVYQLLTVKLGVCQKPIFPVLPSVINAQKAIKSLMARGYVNFPDEVLLGKSLCETYFTELPSGLEETTFEVDIQAMRAGLDEVQSDGYWSSEWVNKLLDSLKILRPQEALVSDLNELAEVFGHMSKPVVMKAVGPLHKSDVGGVILDIHTFDVAAAHFDQLMQIEDCHEVLLQQQVSGQELFVGVKYEAGFGHLLLMGLGGIYVEILHDVQVCLCPCDREEIQYRLTQLQSFPLIQGVRGQAGINMDAFIEVIEKISFITQVMPEIQEMDINPLVADEHQVQAVDMRVRTKQEPSNEKA